MSRSSMIEGNHRRSRATIAQFIDSLTSQAIIRRIIFIKFILYGEFVQFLSRLLKRFSHLYVAQEAKTGFHVSTRPAWENQLIYLAYISLHTFEQSIFIEVYRVPRIHRERIFRYRPRKTKAAMFFHRAQSFSVSRKFIPIVRRIQSSDVNRRSLTRRLAKFKEILELPG